MNYIQNEVVKAMKLGGLKTLFSDKAAEKSFEQYVSHSGKEEELHANFKVDILSDLNAKVPTKKGYSTLEKELRKEGIGFQSVPGEPTYILAVGKGGSEKLGTIDGNVATPTPGKEGKFKEIWGKFDGKRQEYGRKAKPGKDAIIAPVRTTTDLEHPPGVLTDLNVEPTVEGAMAILKGFVPQVEKKMFGYKPKENYNYKKTLGHVMDSDIWGDSKGKKVMHEALKIMKNEASGEKKKAVNILKRDFEKDQKVYRARDWGLGMLALGGGLTLAEEGNRLGWWNGLAHMLDTTPGADYVSHSHLSPDLHATVAAAIDKDHVMTADEKAFVYNTGTMDDSSQHAVVSGLVGDGVISHTDAQQAHFLSNLTPEQRTKEIAAGNVAILDIDEDGKGNDFEQLTGSPYNVKNNVYVIMFTHAGPEYPPSTEMHEFLTKVAKIPENHIIWRYGQDNNSENLMQAINTVSHEAGKNDDVLTILGGEGVKDCFAYWAGEHGTSYQSINNELNKINAKYMPIVVESCYSGSAIPHLKSGSTPRTILTASSAEEKSIVGTAHDFLMAFKNKSADTDGNNYVSVGEAMKYAQQKVIKDNLGKLNPQIADSNNIGPITYLFEISTSGNN
jgi:hypothetical protein